MRYDKENRRLAKANQESASLRFKLESTEHENSRLRSIIDGLLHEAKRLNSEISSFSEDLGKAVVDENHARAADLAESILYASGLVSSRLVFTDFELNPQSLGRQPEIRMGIYKKFDKAKRLLWKAARAKDLSIRLVGTSFVEVEAIPALELVPFVILDNAIKYSPPSQSIDVQFEERPSINCRLRVTVSSIGPLVDPHEISSLLHRGKRGSNATRVKVAGDGMGLFLVDTLARRSNAQISVTSSSHVGFSIDGVPYSNFRAVLDFHKA